ncbi:MAG: hypothetical protein C0624_01905 [Desulfuromonas sp.]|nr:MAG: hypothetical protein C0624_01905 [Desulfuromonas sp.]
MMIVTGLVVAVAGMRSLDSLLVPFLLAIFCAVVCAPLMFGLMRKGVPKTLAVLLVVLGLVVVLLAFSALVGSSADDFYRTVPTYQARLQQEAAGLVAWMQSQGLDVSEKALSEYIDPGAAMRLASRMLSGLGGVLTNSFLIIITMIFILLEASTFRSKLQRAFGEVEETLQQFQRFSEGVKRYMFIKALVSLGTGLSVTLWLAILGVDFPVLWGVLALLLNFVPNIGSIIAAVPAVLVAYLEFGAGKALLAACGYLVVNLVAGNVIEPRYMGRGLGLSTLVVFLSLIFWGWMFGPVGMVLSVPLTMTVKLALEGSEGARWLAVMLGPELVTAEPEQIERSAGGGSE